MGSHPAPGVISERCGARGSPWAHAARRRKASHHGCTTTDGQTRSLAVIDEQRKWRVTYGTTRMRWRANRPWLRSQRRSRGFKSHHLHLLQVFATCLIHRSVIRVAISLWALGFATVAFATPASAQEQPASDGNRVDPEKGTLDGSPLDDLPKHITLLSDTGVRPDWSPNGKQLVILEGAPLGDVAIIDVKTGRKRTVT